MFEKLFKLQEHGTSARTEIIAGVTTFLTMSYIIFVNPDILSTTGMDRNAVFVATCLAAALGSIIMALVANWPIGMAPGMGLNAFSPSRSSAPWVFMAAGVGRGLYFRCYLPAPDRNRRATLAGGWHSAFLAKRHCGRYWHVPGAYWP